MPVILHPLTRFVFGVSALVSPIVFHRSYNVTFLRTHEFLPDGSMSGLYRCRPLPCFADWWLVATVRVWFSLLYQEGWAWGSRILTSPPCLSSCQGSVGVLALIFSLPLILSIAGFRENETHWLKKRRHYCLSLVMYGLRLNPPVGSGCPLTSPRF